MTLEEIEPGFEPFMDNKFMRCWGRAGAQEETGSNKKLCFVAVGKRVLVQTLLDLSDRPDCYPVKYSTWNKGGMFLGRCFMTNDQIVRDLWQRLKPHPNLMCTIQDDDLTAQFRAK
jgi:hypothetical protein